MELENLRTIWRIAMEETPVGERTELHIRALLGRRSHGLVAKMKRNLFGELLLVLAIYIPAILFYLFGSGRTGGEMGWVLLALIVLFVAYYYRKNKLLNEMQCPSCAIRANLDRQVTTLQKYVRFYTIAGTILVPVMGVLSFLATSHPPGGAGTWNGFWIGAAALVSVTVLSYTANVWAMNRLYGRHIVKLRSLLEEMEEE